VPFPLSGAIAVGCATRASLRSCIDAGQLVRVRPGVAVTRASLELLAADPRQYHLAQVRAAQLALGRPGWASGESAATAHDLPRRLGAGPVRAVHIDVPGLPDALLEPYDAPDDLPAFLPVHLHGTGLAYEHRHCVDGVAVTSLARTAVELSRGRPLHISLVPMDETLRRLSMSFAPLAADPRVFLVPHAGAVVAARAQLQAVVDRMRGWPGVVAAREAVASADPRSESPLESCSRGHALEGDLPRPEVGAEVVGDDGRTYFGDLVWRELGVVGEADGWSKYDIGGDPMRRLRAEKRREDALRRAGWIVVRWTSDELRADAPTVVARIAAALREARALRETRPA
jgi:hypothetical protein